MRFWGLTVLLAAAGCGNVRFVDAPFAPREITVAYSVQEDVTVLRWRLGSGKPTSDVRFELLEADGQWHPVDFSTSVFVGGMVACGDGRGVCVQLVLPGRFEPPTAPTVLRAFHPAYGMNPGDAATMQTDDKTLTLQAGFDRGNATMTTTVADLIGGDGVYRFPRPLQRAAWERRAVCVPGMHPADATFVPTGSQAQQTWPAPAALSADGRYCAAVRAVKTTGDPGVDQSIAVDTQPDVRSGDHLYTAPTEITPFSYKIVLDLSIPVADRCGDAMQLIQDTIAQTLGGQSPLRTLPPIDLSQAAAADAGTPPVPCQQSPLRALDAIGLAQDIKQQAAAWPEQHQRFFILYFNNLRAPLPAPLAASFSAFQTAIATPPLPVDFVAQVWGFAPTEVTQSYDRWGLTWEWQSADEMDFPKRLTNYAMDHLPLISEIHDASKPVDIIDPARLPAFDGGLIRLCQVSVTPAEGSALQPVQHDASGNLVPLPPDTRQWPVVTADPPAYLLDLPPVNAVPMPGFQAHEARIRYEVCMRWCDHGFVAESGAAVPSGWTGSQLCMGPGESP
jgi:hypothetical protein